MVYKRKKREQIVDQQLFQFESTTTIFISTQHYLKYNLPLHCIVYPYVPAKTHALQLFLAFCIKSSIEIFSISCKKAKHLLWSPPHWLHCDRRCNMLKKLKGSVAVVDLCPTVCDSLYILTTPWAHFKVNKMTSSQLSSCIIQTDMTEYTML